VSAEALREVVLLHVVRFLLIWGVFEGGTELGLTGWDAGFAANVAATLFAGALMTRRRLWRVTGMITPWRSAVAGLALLPLVLDAISWALPAGLAPHSPGYLWWAATLLLVGLNEEMFSRGVVLHRLRSAYAVPTAVVTTAVLFGLQHLSSFALSSQSTEDVLENVVLTALYGFALAAFQARFAWLWPLVLAHATADFTIVLAEQRLAGWIVYLVHLGWIGYGVVLLRTPPGTAGEATRGTLRHYPG
jgi:membrane protease YdiL (CAAX protease family)